MKTLRIVITEDEDGYRITATYGKGLEAVVTEDYAESGYDTAEHCKDKVLAMSGVF